jgi:hypothetical protein
LNLRQLGLLPIVFISGALVVLVSFFYPESVLPRGLTYTLPAPFSYSYSYFPFLAAIVMSYFFARGFLSSHSVNLATLGVGSLVMGAGFLVPQIIVYLLPASANELMGISSLVFLFSGILFTAFSTLSLVTSDGTASRPVGLLVLGYTGGLVLVGLITVSAASNVLPPFFAPGKGPTLFRGAVIAVSIILYAYSSLVIMRSYLSTRDDILYWFSLGLAATALAFLGVLLGTFPGGPYSWLSRVSLIVGGVYFVAALRIAYKSVGSSRSIRATP